jgi:hypothetical protein
MSVFSLDHFYRLPSIVQILVAEFVMALALGGLVPRVLFVRPREPSPPPLDLSDLLLAAVGLALLAWLLWGVFRPRLVQASWVPVFRAGQAMAVPMLDAEVTYPFATNHPSYVFIDLIVVGFWGFLRWAIKLGDPERLYEGNLWIAVALLVPACRLIAWYVLRLRPAAVDARAQATVRDAWLPVAQLYLFFLFPIALVILGVNLYETLKSG